MTYLDLSVFLLQDIAYLKSKTEKQWNYYRDTECSESTDGLLEKREDQAILHERMNKFVNE